LGIGAVYLDYEVIWYATSMPGDAQSINPVRLRAVLNRRTDAGGVHARLADTAPRLPQAFRKQ
jgi:hypothetical protein